MHDTDAQRFSRTRRLIGAAALRRLQAARVVVVGLGAVGSYAVEGLARAGVGHLKLVDFDVIQPSNINRQLYALESTIGKAKADLAGQRVKDIHPACAVEAHKLFADAQTLDTILADSTDLVVDAIDSISSKVELIAEATRRGIPLVSSMGAARRTDPAAIRVGMLSTVAGCRLARMVRRRLRQKNSSLEVLCVYSVEPMPKDVEAEEEFAAASAPQGTGQRRIIGSLPTLTGIIGLTLANTALNVLLGKIKYPPKGS